MREMCGVMKKSAVVLLSVILAFSLMVPTVNLAHADDPATAAGAQAQQDGTGTDNGAPGANGSEDASANKAPASQDEGSAEDGTKDNAGSAGVADAAGEGPADGAGQGDATSNGDQAQDPQDPAQPAQGEGEGDQVAPLAESATVGTLAIDMNDPAQVKVLEENRFTGLNPANTTVNLYDYTSFKNDAGNDEQNSSAAPSAWLGTAANPNINTGHALTFGNGMNNQMGYWNAGSGSGMGDFAKQNPGFQNIVQPKLGADGYPMLSETSMNVKGYSDVNNAGAVGTFDVWPQVGGYASNPPLYANAKRVNAQWSNGQPVFPNAGGKNISDQVQSQWNKDLSLGYLFNPDDTGIAGRAATHTDVKGLFQLDDQGYYYYNMRKNFASYTAEAVQGRSGTIPANSFILYDEPAGIRTDGANSVGNFFPFNTGQEVFKIQDGKLESNIYATNGSATATNPGAASNLGQGLPLVNHNLGMSMETRFRQPTGGTVGSRDMTFEFIGDDDLWVFIDDVLVLDLGGIHSELYGTINFSTGDVKLGTAFDSNGEIVNAPVRTTTIKDMFDAAGVDTSTGFRGNTFSSNTSHTLKMFYFERGNYDSSLSVRFNLQPELYQQVKKVNQDGDPVEGAVFDLFPVTATTAGAAADATLDTVTYDATATPLTSVTTREDGMAQFTDNGQPFNFADRVSADNVASQLFVLRERTAPAGYRMMPIDILMRYDQETGTFVVNNRYDTGSYASFNSYVTQIAPERLRYGLFDTATETIVSTDAPVSLDQQKNGLVVGIPTLKQPSGNRWNPIYGSNNSTLHVVGDKEESNSSMREGMLEAVLYQAYLSQNDAHVPGWYLEWDADQGRLSSYHEDATRVDATNRIVCTMSDLPGNPTRYRLNNNDGDMQMVYGIVSSQVFGSGAAGMTAAEKYASLADRVKKHLGDIKNPTEAQLDAAVSAAAAEVAAISTPDATSEFASRGFSAIEASSDQFERNFRTMINIPNEQRELRVWKVDQNEDRVNGAVFALFDTKEKAQNAVRADVDGNDVVTAVYDAAGNAIDPYAAGVTGDLRGAGTKYKGDDIEGMLVFAPYVSNGAGAAHTEWTQGDDSQNGRVLYMKEVQAPAGFNPNDTIVPVVIGQYGVYADAGNAADGIDVLAGVGKLSSTMTKFAASPEFNLTLRYITSIMQTQPSSSVADGATSVSFDTFNNAWQENADKKIALEYGVNALVDYGSPTGFTPEQLEQGVGYVDAAGNQRPLFRATSGFVRAAAEQDTAALEKAMREGEHAGVAGDLLPGQSLTNLFMIRNTVRVTDVKRPTPELAKVDQHGNPVPGAAFALYPVNAPEGTTDANLADVTLEAVQDRVGADPVATCETDAQGMSVFYGCNPDGTPTRDVLDFAQRAAQQGMDGGRLYLLRETKTPAGFRKMTSDLLVRYEPATGMFIVNNRYQTGASASFASFVTVDSAIHYGTFQDGVMAPGTETVASDVQKNGLVVAIPTIQTDDGWKALHGDVSNGFQTVGGTDDRALLEAALNQSAGSGKPWHLAWNDSLESLTGHIEGLPGVADDYRLFNPQGKYQMVYAVISPEALEAAGVEAADSSDQRYQNLGKAVSEKGLDAVLGKVAGANGGFRTIDPADFDRSFQPVVYVPNEQRELRLWKVNTDRERVDGAAFALFETRGDAQRAAGATVEGNVVTAVTDGSGAPVKTFAAGVTGVPGNGDKSDTQHGTIVFAPYVENGEGAAKTLWINEDGSDLTGKVLYLKEVNAPEGYKVNDTIIPVVIGKHGIYVDAGTEDDGVDVLAGVGKLAVPLTKLASSPDVDITLRYITSTAQTQPSLQFKADGSLDDTRVSGSDLEFEAFNKDWQATDKTMNLEYGASNALVSYGHPGEFTEDDLAQGIGYPDAYGNQRPLFRSTTGFLRTGITQDMQAMRDALAQDGSTHVGAQELEGQDLLPLFSIRNTVRVVDQKEDPNEPTKPEQPEKPEQPTKPNEPVTPPSDPEQPEQPGNPTDPSDPQAPSTPGTSEPGTDDPTGLAKTADAVPQGALLALGVVAALALALLLAGRARRRA